MKILAWFGSSKSGMVYEKIAPETITSANNHGVKNHFPEPHPATVELDCNLIIVLSDLAHEVPRSLQSMIQIL